MIKKPEEVLIGEPGKIVFAEIVVQNSTKWPWKRGCYLGVANKIGDEECPVKVNNYPID